MIAAMVIVCLIAVFANPQSLAGLPVPASVVAVVTPVPSQGPAYIPINTPQPVTPTGTPTPVPTDAPPYRIFYTDKPLTYPVFNLPENMVTFGASDIPQREELVTFAFVEDIRGGLTRVFSIPYPVWIINTTVISDRNPQYGNFRMVLCYASNGTVIKGEEILNRGSTYRIVQTYNTPVYMIVSTSYIDSYRIDLQTPRKYYDAYRFGRPFFPD
jgi:hypothetical protein